MLVLMRSLSLMSYFKESIAYGTRQIGLLFFLRMKAWLLTVVNETISLMMTVSISLWLNIAKFLEIGVID